MGWNEYVKSPQPYINYLVKGKIFQFKPQIGDKT